jgi:hypothetical protein
LLFCTLFGLAAMHTLGHTGVGADAHAVPAVAGPPMAAVPDPVVVAFTAASVDDCGDDHCDGHGPSGWSICLAILGGLATMVLLMILLLAALRDHRRAPGAAAPGIPSPRAPPERTAGLTLVSAAVLRI